MTYKISLGWGNIIATMYSDGIIFNKKKSYIHYLKPLESILAQTVEFLEIKHTEIMMTYKILHINNIFYKEVCACKKVQKKLDFIFSNFVLLLICYI